MAESHGATPPRNWASPKRTPVAAYRAAGNSPRLRSQADALGKPKAAISDLKGRRSALAFLNAPLHNMEMPQSLAKIYLHLIFSTKNRERWIPARIRSDLHSYMGGILRDLGCNPVEINTEEDHAHLLFTLSRTEPISAVVGQLKKGSNEWLRTQGGEFSNFYWQGGYGVFSISQSAVDEVREYIRTQQEHHQRISFQDEFRALLRRYQIEFDERYVWD